MKKITIILVISFFSLLTFAQDKYFERNQLPQLNQEILDSSDLEAVDRLRGRQRGLGFEFPVDVGGLFWGEGTDLGNLGAPRRKFSEKQQTFNNSNDDDKK